MGNLAGKGMHTPLRFISIGQPASRSRLLTSLWHHSMTKRDFRMPEESPKLKFVRLTEHARTPTRGSAAAAGFDLYSAYDYRVPSGGRCVCLTDLQVCVPDGCYGRVAPRSGLASKNGIDVGAGVVDADYRGNLGVLLFNFGDSEFTVSRGDRIAQFICERITYPELVECQSLDDTERGGGGFGSTGLRG
ncbi:deoxyuridine triphosphatase [Amblyomma americanum]